MYKKFNTSMDSNIHLNSHHWIGKDISINQIRDYTSDNLCRHVCKPKKLSPPPRPPPPQSSISQ